MPERKTFHSILLTLMFCTGVILPTQKSRSQSSKNPIFSLQISFVDKDSTFDSQVLKLQTTFKAREACKNYINQLPSLLAGKGYPTASVDSVFEKENGTLIKLFLGKQYKWISLRTGDIDKTALALSRYRERDYKESLLNLPQLIALQQRVINYYENNGYPFAEIFLDSIVLDGDKMEAVLKLNKGLLYKLDSIRIVGKPLVANNFLQHYLDIYRNSLYNRKKLEQVDKKILELPFLQQVQPSDVTLLRTGSILNLYLQPKRSSQADFLVGFLPNNTQTGKLQVTADVNLNLKNALSRGETILFNWQQLQVKSPRLKLGFQQPYILNSNFGFDFLFNLFKKDSTFLQVNAQTGLQYQLSDKQTGKLFILWQNNFLLGDGVDTNLVKATKQLPANIDVNAVNVGLDYSINTTDYRLNPRKGNELQVTPSVGIKNIKKNNEIVNLKDPSFNYASLYDSIQARSYQLKVLLSAAHYFPVGNQATVKAALHGGLYQSPAIFRNELFQIGGYRLLRGFNEESIYATQYAVLSAEYRYRLALNSYLFYFADGGWVKNKYQLVDLQNSYIGTGIGLVFETRFGLLNISYALGKRNDIKFDIREASKIHFGYINYF